MGHAVAAGVLAAWMATLVIRACAPVSGSSPDTAYSLRVSVDDTRALWRAYKQDGRRGTPRPAHPHVRAARQVRRGPARRGLPSHVDESDLVSYGLLGLIGAIERYDPDRDVKFETYAIARIRGAIIDELRAMDWVPRSVRSRAREIERAIARARGEARAARRPTRRSPRSSASTEEELDDEPARDLALVDRGARRAVERARRGGRPGRRSSTRSRTRRGPQPGGGARRRPRLKEAIGEAIAALPEREKLVITLYYYEELTLREIGEVLGVTESRVSQLHTKAILRLRARGCVRARGRSRRSARSA